MTLSRRTLLRGAGVSLALPLLESAPLARGVGGAGRGSAAPRRLAFLYVPNGVHMQDWTPAAEGALTELPWILEPLEARRDDLLVLSGLAHDKARANGDGPGDHARAAAAFLTGAQPFKTAGEGIRVGRSADQLAARQLGDETRLRSLELGCEGGRRSGQCDSGYACVYSNSIAWEGPSTPCEKDVDPRVVFDRLFGADEPAGWVESPAQRVARRRSILDLVLGDARRLRQRLGAADRAKLDEYETGVRELERRIERAAGEAAGEAVFDDLDLPAEAPQDRGEHARLLADLLALAFETDTTRVATFMLGNEGSNRSYRELSISEGHHTLSHHGGDPEKHAAIRRINRYHVAVLAHLLERLAATREGDGRLLDSTAVLYGSGIADGNRHAHHGLPILLAGGGFAGGRHVRYPEETPAANLLLTMLQQAGVQVASLGDATGTLDGLG